MDDEDEAQDSSAHRKKRKVSHEKTDGDLSASLASGSGPVNKSSFKNPGVDTSFLPDRNREEEERKIREELRKEWLRKQEEMKAEEIEITYSYWDGSGHRKSVNCTKGDSIAQFLEKCRQQLPELRGVSVDNLMYIKVSLRSSQLTSND